MAYAGQKVLLVDDDPTFINLYGNALKQKGINYSVAMTGAEAIEKINQEKPSLVLLDIMLPGTDGFEILKRIRQDENTKSTPVWMVTNLGEQSGKNKAVSLGAQDYIVKALTTPLKICDRILNFFTVNPKANQ